MPPLNVTVAGLWHLGCVTSACCARLFQVVGLEEDQITVEQLQAGKAPLYEPGLDELLQAGVQGGRLRFTSDNAEACAAADVLWITYDTPVNNDDEADVEFVLQRIRRCIPYLPAQATVLISSQLPVGTCRKLEQEYPALRFAYSPENLQLGKAIAAFEAAERTVVGTRNEAPHVVLEQLLSPFTKRILWMRTESAEMVKHGLNAFLALSVTFINELAGICEKVGADAAQLSAGLKSDVRIGPKAYLSAGGAFAGGTLARDVVSLMDVAQAKGERLELIPAIKRSNDRHRGWAFRRLSERLGSLKGRRISLLGLAYKPGTNTLRRSLALELSNSICTAGGLVCAFDPLIRQVPDGVLTLAGSVEEAAANSDALVICTEWPEFRSLAWKEILSCMRNPLVLDANRFLEKEISTGENVEYLSVGRA